jgi:hypothetical protein
MIDLAVIATAAGNFPINRMPQLITFQSNKFFRWRCGTVVLFQGG